MRSLFLFLAVFFAVATVNAQVVRQADSLIALRKYQTAYKLLDSKDPKNASPGVVVKKIEVLTKYYTKNIMFNIFGLKDLEKGEDLAAIREQPQGSYQMIPYETEEILEGLIKKHPKDYSLRNTLGNYYYEAYALYGSNWTKPDSVLLDSIKANLSLASLHHATTSESESHLGYSYLISKDYKRAAEHYQRALTLGSNDIDDHYHLSVSLLSLNDAKKALPHATLALGNFKDSVSIGDVSFLLGQIYQNLDSYDSSLKYYTRTLAYNSKYDAAYQHLILLGLQHQQSMQAHTTALQYFATYMDQVSLSAIVEVYHNSEHDKELIDLFSALKERYKNDIENLAGIHLMQGQFSMLNGDKASARTSFETSSTLFHKVYPKDHNIFEAIEVLINSTKE